MIRNSLRYRFGDFLIDPGEQRLTRGSKELHLRPKTFSVLVLMLERSPHLVDRQTFFDRVWPDVEVTDDALSRCIKEARRILADDDRRPRYIRTIPKRGYAFVHPVERLDDSAAQITPNDELPALLPLQVRHRPAHGKRSSASSTGIAVLPFTDMSPNRDQDYFCEGIAEEILLALSRLDGLRVMARTSAFAFKGQNVDARTIARVLNVDTILEGSVRREGPRMRVAAQLVNAADGSVLWADRFDRKVEDVFALQDEIAVAIARQFHGPLASRDSFFAVRRTDLEAYQLFLRGRYFLNRRHPGDHERAIAHFEQALLHDPQYAEPAVSIAEALIVLGLWGFSAPDAAFSRARAFAERALSINEALAEAHLHLAILAFWHARDRRVAEREFRSAFDLGLRNPIVHGWYASYLIDQGRIEDARKHSAEGLLMDPLSPMVHTVAAAMHLSAGYMEEAKALFSRALELDSGSPVAHHLLGLCHMMMGQDLLAEASLRQGARSGVSNSLALLAVLHMRAGRRQESVDLLAEMERLSGQRWIPAFDRAIVHVALGNEARSLTLIDEALARGEPVIVMTLGHFMSGVLPDSWLAEVKRRTAVAMTRQ